VCYTLRSSSDPLGRLRGGAAGEFGDAVPAAFGVGWMMGDAMGDVVRTRAGCMFAERPAGMAPPPWVCAGAATGAA
jgi:hypothetical protein